MAMQVILLTVSSQSDNSVLPQGSAKIDATPLLRYSTASAETRQRNARSLQYQSLHGYEQYGETQTQAARQYRPNDDHYILPRGAPGITVGGSLAQASTPRPPIKKELFPALPPGGESSLSGSGNSGISGSYGSSSDSSASSEASSGSGWLWPWDWRNWPWEPPYWEWWQYGMVVLCSFCLCCCITPLVCHMHYRQVGGKKRGRGINLDIGRSIDHDAEKQSRRKGGKKKKRKQRTEDEGHSDANSDSSDEAFGDRSLLTRIQNGSYHTERTQNSSYYSQRTSNGSYYSPATTAFSAKSYLQPHQEHLRYVGDGSFPAAYISSSSPQPVNLTYAGY